MLFRGDMPRSDFVALEDCISGSVPLQQCFGYQQLTAYLRNRSVEETHQELPPHLFIIDVSIIGYRGFDAPFPESWDLEIEKAFFDAHPQYGMLVRWPIFGEKYCPEDIKNATERMQMAKTFAQWGVDKLESLVRMLHSCVRHVVVLLSGRMLTRLCGARPACKQPRPGTQGLLALVIFETGWSSFIFIASMGLSAFRPPCFWFRCAAIRLL